MNAAVSRARHEMIVFSTLRSHHLQASRISAQGVLGLKAFLDYAEKGKQVLPAGQAAGYIPIVSHLHRSLASELKALGYETDLHVGTSGYRVDIGVLDPEHRGQYLMGILLDGPMYENAETARDRDILREQVLRQLGWNLLRVWSPDWWENRHSVVRRMVEAIEHVKDYKSQIQPVTRSASEELSQLEQITAPSGKYEGLAEANPVGINQSSKAAPGPLYKQCILDPVPFGVEQFYLPSYTDLILGQIKKVIQEEGPISRSLLTKRILQAWGIARLGAKLDQRFSDLFTRLGLQTTEMEGVIYFWPEEIQPHQYGMFRISAEESQRRAAEDIPPEEVAAAVKAVLDSQISLSPEELVKQVVKILGYARSGTALEKVVKFGIQRAIELGYVLVDENQRIVIK
ncbi:DUF3320 domain-containing protein [Paenibacillus doosanensis]|uniref:DUF3320 domain-containing protein n=1 Tax=Paenibacillus doosanensis TaxID=1229154 RepID=UPI00217F3A2D|nr:DUF3320 domain-containing protein [Paenibacillus doosanensis]